MKRTASRDFTGRTTVAWPCGPDTEWTVAVEYRIWGDEPETNSAGGIEITPLAVYGQVPTPGCTCGGTSLVKINGAEEAFGWLLAEDKTAMADAERECREDAAGKVSGAEEARAEAMADLRAEHRS